MFLYPILARIFLIRSYHQTANGAVFEFAKFQHGSGGCRLGLFVLGDHLLVLAEDFLGGSKDATE